MTNLKTTIDLRFNKLEKTVENLHNDFKLKLFEGIIDNMKGENNQINESLDLDFAKEKNLRQSNHYTIKTPQNEVRMYKVFNKCKQKIKILLSHYDFSYFVLFYF